MKESLTFDKKSLQTVSGKRADYDELAKDCVAFANSIGGHLYIGIEDNEDFPPATQIITDGLPEMIVRKIGERTINVALKADVKISDNGGQFIDLEVFRSQSSIAGTTKGGYFYRDDDQSKPIAPDDLLRAISDKPSFSWETKVSTKILLSQADSNKISKLLKAIKASDRVSDFIKGQTDVEILQYYSLVDEQSNLTHLGILWLGNQPQRARLLYSPTVQYIKYDAAGQKVFKKVWDDYTMSPAELIEDIWNSIPDWKESYEISDGLWRKTIPAYDEKVVREILCNAIAHRPYTTRGDVFINIYPEYMEVVNPGRLPLGVTPRNILQKTVKRNPELSRLFFALHIMEGEGSGYDLMYETQLSLGKSIPVIFEGSDFVRVTIDRKIISKEASRLVEYIRFNYPEIARSSRSMIALGIILQEELLPATKLSEILQVQEDDRLRSYVSALLSEEILLTRGTGKGTKYYINPDLISNAKANIPTTLKTIEPYRLKELILQDLKYHPSSTMSEIFKRIPDVEFEDLQKVVRNMAYNGEIATSGGRKYRRYHLK